MMAKLKKSSKMRYRKIEKNYGENIYFLKDGQKNDGENKKMVKRRYRKMERIKNLEKGDIEK